MPKFAANLSFMFTELDFLDRFGAARAAGFDAVEFLFPYAYEAEAIAEQLARHALRLVLHNLPPGDWAAGDRGIATDPLRVGQFQDSVGLALDYATRLGVRQLHCLAGVNANGERDTYLDNLRFAASQLARHGMTLLIEPINIFDMPGYFLSGSDQAADIIRDAGMDNLRLQFDMYHVQRMEGELAAAITRHLPLIAHMQLADVPGRHEPGSGNIDYRSLFALIDALGYEGWIGCEYHPLHDTLAGLAWRAALQA
ncbi:MAG: 2-oxo-tetronate isomerase [Pseudomonadota bacterium]